METPKFRYEEYVTGKVKSNHMSEQKWINSFHLVIKNSRDLTSFLLGPSMGCLTFLGISSPPVSKLMALIMNISLATSNTNFL